MDHPTVCIITEDELDLNQLLEQITFPSTGAAVLFTGMVRGITAADHPHETKWLEYEAYQPMAEEKMKQIAAEIRLRHRFAARVAQPSGTFLGGRHRRPTRPFRPHPAPQQRRRPQ